MNLDEFIKVNIDGCEDKELPFSLNRVKELIDLNQSKFDAFEKYLLECNLKYNLTAIKEHEEIVLKHFVDSLLGEKFFFHNASVVEIGSGAGFPSIPLLISRNDLKFTLIESVGKKCRFLEEVKSLLDLNATIINGRAEDLKDKRESYSICTARAVARLNTLSEYCLPYVKVGGLFIAYKGSDEGEIEEAKTAINELGGEIERVESFDLEGLGKRNIIVIKKVARTPAKYPRGNGLERKKPL